MEKFELMASYIIPALDSIGKKFILDTKQVHGVGRVHLLKNSNQRIYLIDDHFKKNEYERLIDLVSGKKDYEGKRWEFKNECIFFKDEINFFKKAFPTYRKVEGVAKLNAPKSVRHYNPSEIEEMRKLTMNELTELKKNNGTITYYQPSTSRLEEKIIRYRFKPVELPANAFSNQARCSKRIFIPADAGQYAEMLQGIENYQHIPPGTQQKLFSNG